MTVTDQTAGDNRTACEYVDDITFSGSSTIRHADFVDRIANCFLSMISAEVHVIDTQRSDNQRPQHTIVRGRGILGGCGKSVPRQ